MPDTVFKALVGSRAYGIEREDSDWDWRGAYLAPVNVILGLGELPREITVPSRANHEVILWEMDKFLRLALKSNPSVFEVLWSPEVLIEPRYHFEMTDLIAHRNKLLSRRMSDPFFGYATNQLQKAENTQMDRGRQKHLAHCLRLLFAGIHLLRTGEFSVKLEGEPYGVVTGIVSGKVSQRSARALAESLMQEWERWLQASDLPAEPDCEWVDDWLIALRRKGL